MKKNILMFSGIILFFVIVGTTAYFLPNEISFKIANTQNNFEKAKKNFPKWEIIPQNNELDKLYEQKKYSELEAKIKNISEKKCSLKNEKISEFCANIFYLEGLTEYQLGKDLEGKKQKPFFETAVLDFTKVMSMTDENSQAYIWSKENIEFLQKKFQETQQKENQKKQENKKDKNSKAEDKNKQKQEENSDKSSQKNSEKNAQNSQKSEETQKNTSKEKKEEEKKENERSDSIQKSDDKKASKKDADKQASRLPKEMQKALEETQKKLEQNQQNSKGFNRSNSAAEKDKENSLDPFNMFQNDPFFQDFFGNDPLSQNPFKKNFHKNLSDPDEKDW